MPTGRSSLKSNDNSLRFFGPSRLTHWTLSAVLLFTFSLIIRDVRYSWDHDSGYYLMMSGHIKDGLKPWLDFHFMYTPLVPTLNAGLLALGIPRDWAVYAMPILWILCGAASTFWIAKKRELGTSVGLLLVTFYFLFVMDSFASHMTLEHGVVLFSLLALIFSDKGNFLLSGFFCSLAFLSKQVGALAALPSILLLFSRNDSVPIGNWIRWGLAFLAPIVPFLDWVNYDLEQIYQAGYARYHIYKTTAPGSAFSLMRAEWLRSPIIFILLLSATALGIINALTTHGWKKKLTFLSLICTLMAFLSFRLFRNYYHYTLNCWPFLVLLLADKRRTKIVIGIAIAIIVAYIAEPSKWSTRRIIGRWQQPGIVEALFQPAATRLRAHTEPGSEIILLGEESILAFLSETKTQERFSGWRDFSILDLDHKGQVTVLVDSDRMLTQQFQDEMNQKREQIKNWGYTLAETIVPIAGLFYPWKVEIWKKWP